MTPFSKMVIKLLLMQQINNGSYYKFSTRSGTKRRYEFAFIPNNGFLTSPELLMKDCELKLSFDRANPKIALTKIKDSQLLNN